MVTFWGGGLSKKEYKRDFQSAGNGLYLHFFGDVGLHIYKNSLRYVLKISALLFYVIL